MKKSKPAKYRKVKPKPYWDLYKHGVSQSLLNRFIECRERFRLYCVEGLRERGLRRARDYGTIFHKIIELDAMNKPIGVTLSKWLAKNFKSLGPKQYNELVLDSKIAMIQFEVYKKHFKKRYKYISAEPTFKEEFKLPSGRTILIRGRMDEVIDFGKGIGIQENKTKQRIDMLFIEDTLRSNMQTMLYAWAAEKVFKRPVVKIVYNVIRQPGLRMTNKDKTEADYLKRVKADILKRPSHYFQRRIVDLDKSHKQHWLETELIPLLEHIAEWWDSIKHDPFDPWHLPDGRVNPMHFARPFGIYSAMSNGKGDYYDLMVTGRRDLYDVSDTVFEELVDDDEDADNILKLDDELPWESPPRKVVKIGKKKETSKSK